MKSAKLSVAYPQPKDVQEFDKVYQDERVRMAVARLAGKTKIVATKLLQSPQGEPLFYLHCRGSFSRRWTHCRSASGRPQARKHWSTPPKPLPAGLR